MGGVGSQNTTAISRKHSSTSLCIEPLTRTPTYDSAVVPMNCSKKSTACI